MQRILSFKQDLAILVSSMTDDDEDAEIIGLILMPMTYLIKHHAKSYSFSTHAPFFQRGRYEMIDT
jgi:hypothetical protein